jgi:hypothetical protein
MGLTTSKITYDLDDIAVNIFDIIPKYKNMMKEDEYKSLIKYDVPHQAIFLTAMGYPVVLIQDMVLSDCKNIDVFKNLRYKNGKVCKTIVVKSCISGKRKTYDTTQPFILFPDEYFIVDENIIVDGYVLDLQLRSKIRLNVKG